jgi:hypothetical protein
MGVMLTRKYELDKLDTVLLIDVFAVGVIVVGVDVVRLVVVALVVSQTVRIIQAIHTHTTHRHQVR